MKPCISVIIPSLHAPTVAATLASLRAQQNAEHIGEVLVVGRDGPNVVVQDELVRLIDTGVAVSAPRARNIGISFARYDWLVLIDADCIAQQGWLDALLHHVNAGHLVVGGGVTFATDNYWTLADNLSMFSEALSSHPPGQRSRLPTLNLLLHRTVVERVGIMDEQLPRGEDMDWTTRMCKAGYVLHFEPKATIRHCPPRTSAHSVLQHWWHSGYYMSQVRQRHAEEYGNRWLLRCPLLLQALAPYIALLISIRTLWRGGNAFSKNWRLLPAIYVSKLAWCLGAALNRK
jgi:GT2 family glycosyltransferase